jgi:hypothetical protein
MDVKIAMQNAGIRIAHSLAAFEMRDHSPTVDDSYGRKGFCHALLGLRLHVLPFERFHDRS